MTEHEARATEILEACHEGCLCRCHSDDEDPGTHLETCAWANPHHGEMVSAEFAKYVDVSPELREAAIDVALALGLEAANREAERVLGRLVGAERGRRCMVTKIVAHDLEVRCTKPPHDDQDHAWGQLEPRQRPAEGMKDGSAWAAHREHIATTLEHGVSACPNACYATAAEEIRTMAAPCAADSPAGDGPSRLREIASTSQATEAEIAAMATTLLQRTRSAEANVGAGGGDEDGYNVVDGREAMATRTFIVAWLRNKERFRPGTGWACNEEIAVLIESGDDGELPWGRDDA